MKLYIRVVCEANTLPRDFRGGRFWVSLIINQYKINSVFAKIIGLNTRGHLRARFLRPLTITIKYRTLSVRGREQWRCSLPRALRGISAVPVALVTKVQGEPSCVGRSVNITL